MSVRGRRRCPSSPPPRRQGRARGRSNPPRRRRRISPRPPPRRGRSSPAAASAAPRRALASWPPSPRRGCRRKEKGRRAVDLRGKEEGELREEGGVQDPLRGKEEGELRTACGRKEGCGIQKVGVGGGSHHVGSVGRSTAGDGSHDRPQILLRAMEICSITPSL